MSHEPALNFTVIDIIWFHWLLPLNCRIWTEAWLQSKEGVVTNECANSQHMDHYHIVLDCTCTLIGCLSVMIISTMTGPLLLPTNKQILCARGNLPVPILNVATWVTTITIACLLCSCHNDAWRGTSRAKTEAFANANQLHSPWGSRGYFFG